MTDPQYAGDYFGPLVSYPIEQERCDKIVSKSGENSVNMISFSSGSKIQLQMN